MDVAARWAQAQARALDAARFFRPEFWAVSVFPAWVGWCLATGELLPGGGALAALVRDGLDASALVAWSLQRFRAILALLVLGPLLGGSLMVTNDYYDRAIDVFNPKKARSPLVRGTATPERARAWMLGLSIGAIALAFIVDAWFGVAVAFGVALSFAYSAPPVRLKARPLGDVAVNAFGYGALTLLAGWWLGGGLGIPWGPLLIVVLAITAGYVPTVMMDRDSDARAGLRTTAVTLGLRGSWLIGAIALVGANVTMIGLALMGRYVEPSFVLLLLPFFVLEGFAYATLVRRQEPDLIFAGASLVTLALFGNLAAFLLVYTGVV